MLIGTGTLGLRNSRPTRVLKILSLDCKQTRIVSANVMFDFDCSMHAKYSLMCHNYICQVTGPDLAGGSPWGPARGVTLVWKVGNQARGT